MSECKNGTKRFDDSQNSVAVKKRSNFCEIKPASVFYALEFI